MSVPAKHVLHQGPVLATLAHALWAAMRDQLGHAPAKALPELPSPELTAVLPPRPPELVRDYIRHVGGDPNAYRGLVPAHLFPQWTFPLMSKAMHALPYPILRALNGGSKLEIHRHLPAHEALRVRVRIEEVRDDGRRCVIHVRGVTETASAPEAQVAHLYAIVPSSSAPSQKSGNGAPDVPASTPKKTPIRVPATAEELARWKLGAHAGLDFAKLTGDFNPIHWVAPYARAFGFRSTVLHGFAAMARVIESLQRTMFAGSIHMLSSVDVKFVKPLALPAKVGLYVVGTSLFVGDAPGGPAYLAGEFTFNRGAVS